jgi:hypothetical protein
MSTRDSISFPLPPHQAQLLRDLEAYSDLSCRDICDLRPEVYGELYSSLRRSTQNKYQYLKGLKKTRPDHYWKLYSRASVICPNKDQVEEEEGESLWSSPARQEPEAARSHHSLWRSPTPSFQNQEESTSHSLKCDSPFLAMSFRSPSSSRRKSQVTQESPGQKQKNIFATVGEAEEYGTFFALFHVAMWIITPSHM